MCCRWLVSWATASATQLLGDLPILLPTISHEEVSESPSRRTSRQGCYQAFRGESPIRVTQVLHGGVPGIGTRERLLDETQTSDIARSRNPARGHRLPRFSLRWRHQTRRTRLLRRARRTRTPACRRWRLGARCTTTSAPTDQDIPISAATSWIRHRMPSRPGTSTSHLARGGQADVARLAHRPGPDPPPPILQRRPVDIPDQHCAVSSRAAFARSYNRHPRYEPPNLARC